MRNLLLISILAACGNNAISIKTDVAVKSEQSVANNVKSFASSSSPPTGAASMGMMTQPKAGNTTIPITNVEVFQFQANVDADSSMETMYWASSGSTTYVWGAIDLTCVDDNDQPTGETGSADFVYEEDGSSYGWMTATDSCGYATLFGCSSDGGAETCGGCDWNESFVSCAAASS